MISIPSGEWAIESVLINETTVINNDGIRTLEILESEWVLHPSGQRFDIVQQNSKSAVLESNGVNYYANFEITGNRLSLQLSRPNLKENINFEAEAITADVFVDVF